MGDAHGSRLAGADAELVGALHSGLKCRTDDRARFAHTPGAQLIDRACGERAIARARDRLAELLAVAQQFDAGFHTVGNLDDQVQRAVARTGVTGARVRIVVTEAATVL